MKRCISMLLATLLLTACSVDKEAVQLYKQEKPLEIDIAIPQPVFPHQTYSFTANLRQDGEGVEDAEDVRFTIWNRDSSSQPETMIAHHAGNGLYSVEKTLNREGIYYVKVQARSKGSTIMPTKQFIVGEIKEEFESTPTLEKELHHEHH